MNEESSRLYLGQSKSKLSTSTKKWMVMDPKILNRKVYQKDARTTFILETYGKRHTHSSASMVFPRRSGAEWRGTVLWKGISPLRIPIFFLPSYDAVSQYPFSGTASL